ncbi:MAG: hypothetical protein C0501_05895 [Isosphaera sp.]|nr:hypothetical protein [Isosphaera sp.]
MLRPALFAAAALALVAPAPAADPDLSGTWLLSYSARAGSDQNLMIVKVETKDGKTTASAVFPAGAAVSGFEVKDKAVKFGTGFGPSFEGTVGADGAAVGNLGDDRLMFRAKLTKTDKTEIGQADRVVTTPAPAPAAEAQKLATAAAIARGAVAREKDAEKKKELQEKADAAQKELDTKAPALLREVVAKHADTPFAIDAAADLIRGGAKFGVTADEAGKLLAAAEKAAAPFGQRYAATAALVTVEALAGSKGLEPAAVTAAERLSKNLPADAPAALQARVLGVYKLALEKSDGPGRDAALKTVSAELAKIEGKIDAEYLAKVPPFKPAAFAGRKDKSANRVAVMELFTGAQCPPCVAADVAFDALLKAYKPTDVVLIQYHLHIPGPDPLTNPDAVERARYYGANSTPNTFFNGKAAAAGGGGMANAENKFKQYTGVIDPLLEQTTEVKVAGKATRAGDKLDIAVEVAGGDGEDMRLRLLVVEEDVKYVGGNGLRFHHQVVRAMPGGAAGVAVKDKVFRHTAAADLTEVRAGLTKYLDDFAATRPFPNPNRPMDMKAVRVIALVQNDKTKEIAQAVQIEVEAKPGGR